MNRSQQLPARSVLLLLPCWLALGAAAAAGGGGPGGDPQPAPEVIAAALQDSAPAQPRSLRDALTGGDWWLKLRLRFEQVDQDGIDRDAYATTLRTVLGYETASWHGFSGLLEFEDVRPIGGDGGYNSTTNGVTDRPVVADPKATEVNQAYLRYLWDGAIEGRLGRQRITLDNERFVGGHGWRQNEQTFDALSGEFALPLALTGYYAFVGNVNRINGEASPLGDARMDSHLLHLERRFEGWGQLSLYDYYLDYDGSFLPFSTNSLGARFAGLRPLGDTLELLYALEYARQTDVGDNAFDIDQDYTLLELGAALGSVSVRLGWEVLGGDGSTSFQTPLASLHEFNGWADKFLTTPVNGLEDVYLQLALQVAQGRLQLAYHDFSADSGGASYGKELDLAFTWPLAEDLTLGLKYGGYDADDFATDSTKAWIWLETSL